MKNIRVAMQTLSALVILLAVSTLANAQAFRTWVSGTGDDANPCSRTAPCKTFAGAISKTVAGGEIDAFDAGGFGAVTITKGITIDGGAGQGASVQGGIIVAAPVTDAVTIRNLSITGIGSGILSINAISSGIDGIRFISGKRLHIENCTIS